MGSIILTYTTLKNNDVFLSNPLGFMAKKIFFESEHKQQNVELSLAQDEVWVKSQRCFSRESVLLKVEVCYTSSHVRSFTSSHLRIFTHLLSLSLSRSLFTFTSSHLLAFTYTHLDIFTPSHLYIFSLSLSCSLISLSRSLSFFFFSLSRPQALTRCHDMATFSHETKFECQKPKVCCDFTTSAATFSHETRFECQN